MTAILNLLCIFSSVAVLILVLIAVVSSKRKKLLIIVSIICVIDILLSIFCFINTAKITENSLDETSSIENQSPIDINILYDESIVHSDFHEYTIGNLENENIVKIVFLPNEVLTDISFSSLQYDETSLIIDEKLLTLPAISPEKPLLIGVVFYGDMTAYGISFKDLSGVMRYYSISLSGFDNSLEVLECNAF